MNILDDFEYIKGEFFGWFCRYYSLPKEAFIKSPIRQQCEVILEFLGYPAVIPDSWIPENYELEIKKVLYLYDLVSAKYQCPEDDLLYRLKSISFAEILKVLPEMNRPADIRHGLNEALTKREKGSVQPVRSHLSLSDSLVDIKPGIFSQKVLITPEENFWNTFKTRIHETIPF